MYWLLSDEDENPNNWKQSDPSNSYSAGLHLSNFILFQCHTHIRQAPKEAQGQPI